MNIPADHFRWYAAFHDEGEHPHIHMMAWSSQPKEGWLDRDGIHVIRSRLTNQIFQQEMLHLYEQKTVARDELVREARASMLALAEEMGRGVCDHPEVEELMLKLAQALDGVTGKKKYGYLPKPVKRLVDEIVDEMERLPTVAKCHEQWQTLQSEVELCYSDTPPKKKKLSERKEFRQIKNAVVAAACSSRTACWRRRHSSRRHRREWSRPSTLWGSCSCPDQEERQGEALRGHGGSDAVQPGGAGHPHGAAAGAPAGGE